MISSAKLEEQVLSLIICEEANVKYFDRLQKEMFTTKINRDIYDALKYLIDNDKHVSTVAILEYFKHTNKIKETDKVDWILAYMPKPAVSRNIIPQIETLNEYYTRRYLQNEFLKNSARVEDIQLPLAEIAGEMSDMLRTSVSATTKNSFYKLSKLLSDYDDLRESGGLDADSLSTGFHNLDCFMKLVPGELIIVAARPGDGKTALAVNFMKSAIENEKNVLMFSLEMNETRMTERLLACISGIPSYKISNINSIYSDEELKRLEGAMGIMGASKVFIDFTPQSTIRDIKNKTYSQLFELKSKYGENFNIDLIIVDYLQFVKGHKGAYSREDEVATISRGLKSMAKELDVPVVACAQLNRNMARDGYREPQLSDIRDSGAIEQDADLVVMIHPDKSPKKLQDYKEHQRKNNIDSGTEMNIILGKSRNAEKGTAMFTFYGSTMRFVETTIEKRKAFYDKVDAFAGQQPSQMHDNIEYM